MIALNSDWNQSFDPYNNKIFRIDTKIKQSFHCQKICAVELSVVRGVKALIKGLNKLM
jgi:hypothetical protein